MRITAVTSVKDEGPFLLEWLAWHRLLGATDFFICANDCTDGTDSLLRALAGQGLLTFQTMQDRPGKSIQWRALKRAWEKPLSREADWLLVSDVDEFPMIHAGAHRFADLFAALPEGTDAVALPWRFFGNDGQVEFQDRPVTQSFFRAAPAEMIYPVGATQFKTLFRPQAFAHIGVHRPEHPADAPARWVDGSGSPMSAAFAGNSARLSLLGSGLGRSLCEMHHYSLRSLQSYLVKSERGLPNRKTKEIDLAYWVERNFNAEENRAATALGGALAAEIEALMALPQVADLHRAACEAHVTKARALMRQLEYYRLHTLCRQAGSSAVLSQAEARDLYARFQRLHRPD